MSNIDNALNTGRGATSLVGSVGTGIGTIAGDIKSPVLYRDQLQDASFRELPFVVESGSGSFGRKQAVHEYPKRDIPWAEDLGRKGRIIRVTGFLIGDDVIAQRENMIAAVEKPGDATLVHPTYGKLTVNVLDFSVDEDKRGRRFGVHFVFLIGGQRIFPNTDAAAQNSVADASSAVDTTSLAFYLKKSATALQKGAAVVDAVTVTANTWIDIATKVVQDSTTLYQTAASLPGEFGRYFNQALHGFASGAGSQPSTVTLQSLVAAATAARVAVASTGLTLLGFAGVPTSFASTAQILAAAVANATASPLTAISMLASLAAIPSDAPTQASAIGAAQSANRNAASDLFRRAAIAQLAIASGNFYPTSADEAAEVRSRVCGLIGNEALAAADAGDDAVYLALKTLNAQVAQDLATKGASLPEVVTISSRQSLPSLVLAQQLYRDVTRADELVTEANPIHPAFMPLSFKGLSR